MPTRHSSADRPGADAAAHVVPVSVYLRSFAALVGLLALTLAAARLPLGAGPNSAVAFTIALAKAVIVVLYFMQVRYATRLTWVWAGIGFFWLIIMFAI
ncbi:MAG: hypothetical protein FJX72_03450, partial [Armatimonadetes bacterium]|nr:hypothetical protein [Armatimonadota bacterium]